MPLCHHAPTSKGKIEQPRDVEEGQQGFITRCPLNGGAVGYGCVSEHRDCIGNDLQDVAVLYGDFSAGDERDLRRKIGSGKDKQGWRTLPLRHHDGVSPEQYEEGREYSLIENPFSGGVDHLRRGRVGLLPSPPPLRIGGPAAPAGLAIGLGAAFFAIITTHK